MSANPRLPTLRQEKLIEGVLQGKSKRQAALDAGYAETTANVDVYAMLEKPWMKARIAERIAESQIDSNEIIGTLVSHMRADLADIYPDDEILQAAKAAGVSHLIKKIRRRERFIPNGSGREPDREVTTEIEVHDSQSAAKHLASVFGLEIAPQTHPADLENDMAGKVVDLLSKGKERKLRVVNE